MVSPIFYCLWIGISESKLSSLSTFYALIFRGFSYLLCKLYFGLGFSTTIFSFTAVLDGSMRLDGYSLIGLGAFERASLGLGFELSGMVVSIFL